MSLVRTSLPHRRPSWTTTIVYRDQPLHVTVGFDPVGAPREVFATGPREGSDMSHTLADACVIVSIALQHGIAPVALAKSLGTLPVIVDGEGGQGPASPIGAVLGVLTAGEWVTAIEGAPR